MRDSADLVTGVRNLQAWAMASKVDPKAQNQIVMHHPYAWARWMLYSAQPAPAVSADFKSPMDVFEPKTEEPTSPYGDDESTDTSTSNSNDAQPAQSAPDKATPPQDGSSSGADDSGDAPASAADTGDQGSQKPDEPAAEVKENEGDSEKPSDAQNSPVSGDRRRRDQKTAV